MSAEVMKARIMNVMRNLPPLPQVTRQLLVVIRDEAASAEDVAKVLSSDQALAGKVLKLVNSSFYGVQSEVTKISRAVVILGFTGIRNLAMGFGSVEALSRMNSGLDMTHFWSHAMTTAAAAQALAPHVKHRTDPEEAFIAGLMHDIGAYVLATAVPDQYKDLLEDPEGLSPEKEAEAIGFTHAQVGQGLLKFWDLPEPFTNAARYHHDVTVATSGEQPLTSLVALADVLACAHGGAFEIAATEEHLSRLMHSTGVTPDLMCQAFAGMDQKIEEMSVFMNIAGARMAPVAPALPEGAQCVVISSDNGRRQWTTCLLGGFGYETYPSRSYFNQEPGASEVDLVLLDPEGLTAQQLEQLVPFLASQPARTLVLCERDVPVPEAVADFSRLPFIFSRHQLNQLLTTQTA